MNKTLIIFIPCLFLLSGCEMSRTETIAAIKECEDAGMRAEILRNGIMSGIRGVNCLPKRNDK